MYVGRPHPDKEKRPSLEVAPTTAAIYSFQWMSAFPSRCRIWFSQFHSFTLKRKGAFSFCDLELLPTTLTHELDVDRVKVNYRAKCQSHSVRQLSCEHTHTHTHTDAEDRLQHLVHKMVRRKLDSVTDCFATNTMMRWSDGLQLSGTLRLLPLHHPICVLHTPLFASLRFIASSYRCFSHFWCVVILKISPTL